MSIKLSKNNKFSRRTVLKSGAAAFAVGMCAISYAADTSRLLTLKNGEPVPPIGMGTWLTFNIDPSGPEAARRKDVLEVFFANGGGMIDSSPMYGRAEAAIGELMVDLETPASLFSATKVWTPFTGTGPEQLQNSRELWRQTESNPFDLVHVHNLLNWEDHLPMLREAKEREAIRYVGLTTSHGRRHGELERLMKSEPIDAVQFTYNILDREAGNRLLPAAKEAGIPVIINRPFQGGALFDRFQSSPLPDWAGEIGCNNWAEFFLKFIISHPGVDIAIPATSNPEHMMENMGASRGSLPNASQRKDMIAYIENL